MTNQTETRLPWGKDTITITGYNAGTQALTVHFDKETLNIIDFLNTSLNAEYAFLYEEIMSRYEAKLKSGTLFDHGFPETAFTPHKLAHCQTADTPADDKPLIDALIKEYNVYLGYTKDHFMKYEGEVRRWFEGLSI